MGKLGCLPNVQKVLQMIARAERKRGIMGLKVPKLLQATVEQAISNP